MVFIVENLRLAELVAVVNANRPYFDEFIAFLNKEGYTTVREFVSDPFDERAKATIHAYLLLRSKERFYDGVLRPFPESKARWYFLAWIFRDAPAQRLGPLVAHAPGQSTVAKQSHLLNEIRKFVIPLFPNEQQWEWHAIAEVFLSRLEGSRRALKGNLFEGIVRVALNELFERHNLHLSITPKQRKLHDETYDVEIVGARGSILIPVKTRETMGGGHAMLFTRDIHKSISVAVEAGFVCVPVVIAESWGGNLTGLACDHFIHIQANPNQLQAIEPILREELEKIIVVFNSIS